MQSPLGALFLPFYYSSEKAFPLILGYQSRPGKYELLCRLVAPVPFYTKFVQHLKEKDGEEGGPQINSYEGN